MIRTQINIRPYQVSDREAVREIAYQTAFLGRADSFITPPDILKDMLTLYFTDFESKSCFVACSSGRVIGYVFGAQRVISMRKVFMLRILPRLIYKSIRGNLFAAKCNRLLTIELTKSFVKGELSQKKKYVKEFPSVMHINISSDYRKLNVGRQLVATFLQYLHASGISGVQLATMSESAKIFFLKQDFQLLGQTTCGYLSRLLKSPINYYHMGKKL